MKKAAFIGLLLLSGCGAGIGDAPAEQQEPTAEQPGPGVSGVGFPDGPLDPGFYIGLMDCIGTMDPAYGEAIFRQSEDPFAVYVGDFGMPFFGDAEVVVGASDILSVQGEPTATTVIDVESREDFVEIMMTLSRSALPLLCDGWRTLTYRQTFDGGMFYRQESSEVCAYPNGLWGTGKITCTGTASRIPG